MCVCVFLFFCFCQRATETQALTSAISRTDSLFRRAAAAETTKPALDYYPVKAPSFLKKKKKTPGVTVEAAFMGTIIS